VRFTAVFTLVASMTYQEDDVESRTIAESAGKRWHCVAA
jgi:hypothetical protein